MYGMTDIRSHTTNIQTEQTNDLQSSLGKQVHASACFGSGERSRVCLVTTPAIVNGCARCLC